MNSIKSAQENYWDRHGVAPKPAPQDDATWLAKYQQELRESETRVAIQRMIERGDAAAPPVREKGAG